MKLPGPKVSEPWVSLAPMDGITDLATRLWFSQTYPPPYAGTPFLRVTQGYRTRSIPKVYAPELDMDEGVLPYRLTPQLMASTPVDFCRIAEGLLQRSPVVELNCGCPAPRVVGHGGGSSLLETQDRFSSFLEGIAHRIGPQSVSVKMRTGFDSDQGFEGLIDVLAQRPWARVVIHGRTRRQRYLGFADWELIERAACRLSSPVIGSGDLENPDQIAAALDTSVRGVMVGRGALRDPWIFNPAGVPVQVGPETMKLALSCFGVMQYQQLFEPDRLIVSMTRGRFADPCGTDPERWRRLFADLVRGSSLVRGCRDFDLPLPTVIMGRVKMLWSFIRKGWRSVDRGPSAMRSQSFGEFSQHAFVPAPPSLQ